MSEYVIAVGKVEARAGAANEDLLIGIIRASEIRILPKQILHFSGGK